MTCLIKILISPWLLKQIERGFRWDADSYHFIILKHILINSQFRKILMLKVRLSSSSSSFFFWGGVPTAYSNLLHAVQTVPRDQFISVHLQWRSLYCRVTWIVTIYVNIKHAFQLIQVSSRVKGSFPGFFFDFWMIFLWMILLFTWCVLINDIRFLDPFFDPHLLIWTPDEGMILPFWIQRNFYSYQEF